MDDQLLRQLILQELDAWMPTWISGFMEKTAAEVQHKDSKLYYTVQTLLRELDPEGSRLR